MVGQGERAVRGGARGRDEEGEKVKEHETNEKEREEDEVEAEAEYAFDKEETEEQQAASGPERFLTYLRQGLNTFFCLALWPDTVQSGLADMT